MELAKYLAAESKGEVLVSMPDNAGNLDALACLRGTEELLIDFIEEKETVLRAGEVMQSVWEQAVTDVYQILKDNNQGACSAGWLQVWSPGLMSQMQCDLSVMISEAAFNTVSYTHLDVYKRQVYFHFISRLEELSSVGIPFLPQRIALRGENQCPGLLR